jgi:high-affinity Fe2+/Pb2+ permease
MTRKKDTLNKMILLRVICVLAISALFAGTLAWAGITLGLMLSSLATSLPMLYLLAGVVVGFADKLVKTRNLIPPQ